MRSLSATRQRHTSQKHTVATPEEEAARLQRRDELRALNQIMHKLEELQFEDAMRSVSLERGRPDHEGVAATAEEQRLHCLSPVAIQMSV